MKSAFEWTRRLAVFLWATPVMVCTVATPVMVCTVFIPGLVFTPVLAAQDNENGLITENPLDEIRDELVRVLDAANLPFTPEQEDSITFVLEESRRASENLFGNVMNFSGGPPRGEELDRAMAGIAWINEDFSERVAEYLTAEQRVVWDAHTASRDAAAQATEGTAGTSRQVQQIRVNRNPFTAENQFSGNASSGGSYGFSSGGGIQTQIINRGGTGAWHGSYSFNLQDEALDARNPFAANKPTYQQRNINLNTSGPLIRDRLTFGGRFNQSMQDSALTVNATTLDGPVQIGFTQPLVFRNGGFNGTYQATAAQSVEFNYNRQRFDAPLQGVGDFNLFERGIDYVGGNDSSTVRHIWFASERWVQDISVSAFRQQQESTPRTTGPSIQVLGAFNGGGGSNRTNNDNSGADFRSLWIYSGDRWTIRTGWNFRREVTNERSETNFEGSFIFSDLDSFREDRPILYTQNRGDPVLEISQSQWSAFFQNEFQATDRITMFFGLRYERQTNLADHNNLDPRVGVAFALDNSTVVRAGAGIFHMRVGRGIQNTLARFDGARQFQIVIENPSYPDPFLAGDVMIVTPSSRRVQAANLTAPYSVNTSYQIERSLPGNLFVTASFDYQRGFHLLRSRNLNAPIPGLTERPNPAEGNVWQLESSGISRFRAIRLTMRQRFSIFNVNATYGREVNGNVLANFGAPTDNFNLRGDYAETVRHQFNARINNRLFWEIFLNTNVTYSSGNWYTITTGRDDNGDGVTNDRPHGVPRNSLRGPHHGNVSFNLTKSFSLGGNGNGGPSLNLRANFNNAFNRTNLGTPVGILTSPSFGRSIRATNPRQISLEMRFQF